MVKKCKATFQGMFFFIPRFQEGEVGITSVFGFPKITDLEGSSPAFTFDLSD